MEPYEPGIIEPARQKLWQDAYRAEIEPGRPKRYVLEFFPYPSGHGLSVGHCRNYATTDALARFLRMCGFNVLHPMGWDAFGQPAEMEAIKKGSHPKKTVPTYVAEYKRQLDLIGMSYDWSREINSSEPEYYRWTQWIFLQLYRRGLAYRANAPVNWCPNCRIVLANEEVEGGLCWRCDTKVEKKPLTQWFFKITAYAERLLSGLDGIDWPEGIKTQQRNWIGRSEGVEFRLGIEGSEEALNVFTTRIDTAFGVTFAVLSPEHPLVSVLTTDEQRDSVEAYVETASRLEENIRMAANRERTGVFTGSYAINPFNGERIPIYVADYVLMGYGSGAIMAVPGHDERDFEFAKRHGLEIRQVIECTGWTAEEWRDEYTADGPMVNSGEFSGLSNREGMVRMAEQLESRGIGQRRVNYRLRDWLISRQRYWGAPIPIVHCEKCGVVPVSEDQLPVLLPDIEEYQPTNDGRSPLALIPEFVNVSCPECGGMAQRETDTMGGFACSSWYFLRFADPHNDHSAFSRDTVDYWLPVDYYVGGAEHAVMHLLYARFWTKFLYDEGLIGFDEPFVRLRNQGMLQALTPYRPPSGEETVKLGEPGILVRQDELGSYDKDDLIWVWEKMSKSKENVVTPDEVVEKYGADTLRLWEMFVAPFDQSVQWDENGVRGVNRYLHRLWRLAMEFLPNFDRDWRSRVGEEGKALRHKTHATIKKVRSDLEGFRFNTAVAAIMEWTNELSDHIGSAGPAAVASEALESLILVLAPLAPHITDELWSRYGFEGSVHTQPYPEADESLAEADEITLIIQVNGKLRDRISVPAGIGEEEMRQLALNSPKVGDAAQNAKKVIVVPGRLVNIVV